MNEINKNKVNFYQISDADDNQRLDNLLIKVLKGVPKSHIYKIIRGGEVRINKSRCAVNSKVQLNDIIRIPPIKIAPTNSSITKPILKCTFAVLFEDDYYLIINKPSGVACHGGSGISAGVIEHLRQDSKYRLYKFLELAHRLDKDTSGILILAKKRTALLALQQLMRQNQVTKEYFALCLGNFSATYRNVKLPISKFVNPDGERRVKIDKEHGQFAHTIFTSTKNFRDFSLLNARIHTGRTHQIRIHLHHIGHPIAGDAKYGNFTVNKQLVKGGLKRMFLHAHHVSFIHPFTDSKIEIRCSIPPELEQFLITLP